MAFTANSTIASSPNRPSPARRSATLSRLRSYLARKVCSRDPDEEIVQWFPITRRMKSRTERLHVARPGFYLPDDAPWEWQMLWNSVCNVATDDGPPLVVLAFKKGMATTDLYAIELTGDLPDGSYPILKFGSDEPDVSYWFSPQGAFRRQQFA